MKFSVPGKTYLVGEYSVLVGGAALGLSTAPQYIIEDNVTDFLACDLHPESAASQYLAKTGKQRSFSIEDPYQGGFGRSTAEFWGAIVPDLVAEKEYNFFDIMKLYRELHNGSGIDLAFQYFGQICLADAQASYYQNLAWPFPHLQFLIVSTGVKIPTHEHLKNLDKSRLNELPQISESVIKSFTENREFEFLARLKDWRNKLKELGLTCSNSLRLIEEIENCAEVKLVKPCGALGADVLLVFFAGEQKQKVVNYLIEHQIRIEAGITELVAGVREQIVALREARAK